MPGYELGHLEHADLLLAVEDRLQIVVGIDERLLLGILQPVLFDVGPKFFRQLSPGKGLVADHFSQGLVRRDRLHEGRIGCSFRLFHCF